MTIYLILLAVCGAAFGPFVSAPGRLSSFVKSVLCAIGAVIAAFVFRYVGVAMSGDPGQSASVLVLIFSFPLEIATGALLTIAVSRLTSADAKEPN